MNKTVLWELWEFPQNKLSVFPEISGQNRAKHKNLMGRVTSLSLPKTIPALGRFVNNL